jgi:small redox-active disulfide protein 2
MKKIQILGTGCAKCQKLAAVADEAARALGVPYELEKVTDLKQIMSFKVMSTPALVVDGHVKLSGRVPTVEEAKQLINGAL